MQLISISTPWSRRGHARAAARTAGAADALPLDPAEAVEAADAVEGVDDRTEAQRLLAQHILRAPDLAGCLDLAHRPRP